MRVVRGGHLWQFGSIASLATETTDGEILVAFWPKHGLRSDLRVPNFKKFPGGACPQTPLACSHLRLRDTVRGVVRAPNARYFAMLNRT